MNDQEKYQRARRRVEEIKAYYIHLFTYILVNIGLFTINMLTSPETLWFYWATLGWGIGLLVHTFVTFGMGSFFGRDWEEREIRKLMEKEN